MNQRMLGMFLTFLVAPCLAESSALSQTDWRLTATEHFGITLTAIATGDVQRIAGAAERAYRQVSSQLMHELSLRPLIVVFGTRSDLARAIASGTVPGNREHLLWTLDTPAAEINGAFVHGLTHVFAFDVVPVSVRRDVPGWLQEGLAEFARGEWSDSDRRFVRDMLRSKTLPTLRRLPGEQSTDSARLDKIFGHLAFDFLVMRAGPDGLKRVLLLLRESRTSPMDTYLAALGLAGSDFDREFGRYVRTRFAA